MARYAFKPTTHPDAPPTQHLYTNLTRILVIWRRATEKKGFFGQIVWGKKEIKFFDLVKKKYMYIFPPSQKPNVAVQGRPGDIPQGGPGDHGRFILNYFYIFFLPKDSVGGIRDSLFGAIPMGGRLRPREGRFKSKA